MPKVSILIPIYNSESYLEECLTSVCGQTLSDIEIICIDDGSTDRSGLIVDEFAKRDKRIIPIHKSNTGYGNSMNIGLDCATGEYIGIVESDDYIPENMMQTLYEHGELYSVDFVKADFYRFVHQADGKVRKILNRLSGDQKYYNRVFRPLDEVECFSFVMNIWSGIYRTDFLKNNHIRFNETKGAAFQDNGFWFQTFVLSNRVLFLDKAFYMNRRDNPCSSVNNKDKAYLSCVEYDYIRDWIDSKPFANKAIKYLCSEGRIRNYLFTIQRISDELKPEFYNRFYHDYKMMEEKEEICFTHFPVAWQERIVRLLENHQKACEIELAEAEKYRRIMRDFQDIIIFGAGAYGKKVLEKLQKIGARNRVAYIAVTEKANNPSFVGDIPVVQLDELSVEFTKNAIVLIALKDKGYVEAYAYIKSLGFENISDGREIL